MISSFCAYALILWLGPGPLGTNFQTERLWSRTFVTSDDITVFSRDLADTDILELRAECIVDVPPENVFDVVLRQDTYKYTSKHVVEFRIVGSERDNVWYIYQRLAIPLFSDRDYTLRYEALQDSMHGRSSLSWTTANDKGPPPREDAVRIEVSRGAIEMHSIENGKKTRLTCTIFVDPGGRIPDWLANIGNRTTLPDVLRAIRDGSIMEQRRPKGER